MTKIVYFLFSILAIGLFFPNLSINSSAIDKQVQPREITLGNSETLDKVKIDSIITDDWQITTEINGMFKLYNWGNTEDYSFEIKRNEFEGITIILSDSMSIIFDFPINLNFLKLIDKYLIMSYTIGVNIEEIFILHLPTSEQFYFQGTINDLTFISDIGPLLLLERNGEQFINLWKENGLIVELSVSTWGIVKYKEVEFYDEFIYFLGERFYNEFDIDIMVDVYGLQNSQFILLNRYEFDTIGSERIEDAVFFKNKLQIYGTQIRAEGGYDLFLAMISITFNRIKAETSEITVFGEISHDIHKVIFVDDQNVILLQVDQNVMKVIQYDIGSKIIPEFGALSVVLSIVFLELTLVVISLKRNPRIVTQLKRRLRRWVEFTQ